MKKLIDLLIGFMQKRKINWLGFIIWTIFFQVILIMLLRVYWEFAKLVWNLW